MSWSLLSPVALQPALHLGKLHAYEHLLVWLLAFGPVLLLAVTVHIARKRAREEDDQARADERGASGSSGS